MSNIELIGLRISVYTRIACLALEEKEVDYTLREVDIFADGGPPADYLEQHPFGTIPCMKHDNFTLYETGAITRYVDEAFPGQALQPEAPAARDSRAIEKLRRNPGERDSGKKQCCSASSSQEGVVSPMNRRSPRH